MTEIVIVGRMLLNTNVGESDGAGRAIKYVGLIFLLPAVLLLIGVMTDAVCPLKWGIWFTCLGAFGAVVEAIDALRSCFGAEKGCSIIPVITSLIHVVWRIWGLRVCNEVYSELTGEKPLCLCCCCCCLKTNVVGPAPGNVVMYSPSGQPIYGQPGSAAQMQPSQGQVSQQQLQMMLQQRQTMMQQQQG